MSLAPSTATREAARVARSRRERKALAWQGRCCENCGVELQGPFCHQCGQPERTPIRNLLALSSDAVDYLFDVDARVYRTLTSLYFFPGRLTELYLRGKRMSFVRPLRIYLIISALLFIVVNATSDMDGINVRGNGDVVVFDGENDKTGATELADTGADQSKLPPPGEAAPTAGDAPAATVPEGAAKDGAAKDGAAKDSASAAAKAKGADEKKPMTLTFFGDKPWHRTENPLEVAWMPTLANEWLNDYIGVMQANMQLARDDPKRLGHAFLQVLPQSLFVLLPIFALLLKLVLVFKRRLYMEHLMVAIHSHTFIYIAILVSVGLSKIAEFWPSTWTNPWWFLMGLAIAWIPLNLFLTQKRVYRQRWWGAPISFALIGSLYLCLVSFTTLGALVMSLVSL